MSKTGVNQERNRAERAKRRTTDKPDESPQGTHPEGKPDAMKGFRPGPGNTGSMDGTDETGRGQVQHKI
ncbi:MAG TPA: hypothetical protein VN667_03355 [Burkholderiales bacterium]|nr:hypothetical protein [Burkholderiales bacterium]